MYKTIELIRMCIKHLKNNAIGKKLIFTTSVGEIMLIIRPEEALWPRLKVANCYIVHDTLLTPRLNYASPREITSAQIEYNVCL